MPENEVGTIGSIMMFGGNRVPNHWLYCNGQVLQITGLYQNLFDAIGNAYGGDPQQNTFAVPDFRGRVAAHAGKQFPYGDPLTPIGSGDSIGENNVAITVAQNRVTLTVKPMGMTSKRSTLTVI